MSEPATPDQSRLLEKYRAEIFSILGKHHLYNPRLFGSVLKGVHRTDSDIDLVVDPGEEATLLSLVGAESELSSILGISIDLKASSELSEVFRSTVLSESQPLGLWKPIAHQWMSPQLRDIDYLTHIQGALLKIQRNASTYEEFLQSELIQDSNIRALEIIGEAVSRLSLDLKRQYPNVPWEKFSAMRNRLIHGYFDVDLARLWKTLEIDIPVFESDISKIVAAFGRGEEDG